MPEKTKVTSGDIRDLGTKIKGLKTKLDTPLGLLTGLTVSPGDFDAGNNLKTIVEQRRDECIKFLNDVKTQLDQVGTKLGTTADSYVSTEDNATGTAGQAAP